ncbi:type I-C CRISPR-associated protein Cas5c [Streptomyces mayteni]
MTTAPLHNRGRDRGNSGWKYPDLVVETRGPFACFTRPELKVERVSYPLMTPSAARGLLEAIFWKPEFRYVVRRIEILRPVAWFQLRRNEVNSEITAHDLRGLASHPGYRYDAEQDRDQRNTVALRDVAYRIHAQIRTISHDGEPPPSESKYRDQLRRRVERGACFSQPFLGCREFTAEFGPATDAQPHDTGFEELGVMLHSIEYPPCGSAGQERYRWFRATLNGGVLIVPEEPLPEGSVNMPTVIDEEV